MNEVFSANISLQMNFLDLQIKLNSSIDLADNWISLDYPILTIHPGHHRIYTVSDSLGILLLTMCAFGIIGNSLNIIVFSNSTMRTATYIYLRSLSASNLLFIIFSIPLTIQLWNPKIMVSTYTSAYFTAHVLFYLIVGFLYTINLINTLITIERYVAICHPLKLKHLHKTWLAKIICLSAFLLSFAFVIPLCKDHYIDQFDNDLGVYILSINKAYISSSSIIGFTWCRNLIFRVMPCIICIFLTVKIIITFEKLKETRNKMSTNISYSRFKTDKQLYILLILTVTMFFLSCFSGTASSVVGIYGNLSSYTYFVMLVISLTIDRISYGFSFYIYLIFLSHFRKAFMSIFFFKVDQQFSLFTNRGSSCKVAEENK